MPPFPFLVLLEKCYKVHKLSGNVVHLYLSHEEAIYMEIDYTKNYIVIKCFSAVTHHYYCDNVKENVHQVHSKNNDRVNFMTKSLLSFALKCAVPGNISIPTTRN